MGKPQFNFEISAGRKRTRTKTKPETRAEATVYRKDIRAKENQISEAVDWCTENKKRGQAALKTGKFPLIKDRGTIDRRLDGKVKNVKKEHLRVLHPDDEKEIVCFIRNKNRAHQGLSKKEVSEIILDVLKIRDHLNKNGKGGRKFLKLSPSGKMALQNRKLGKSFWRRWHAEHDDIVIKRQGRVKMNRALNCTREMATAHLDALADELIACRIMKNYKKIKKGVWVGDIATERVFNHDETPQFINYGVDGTTAGLVYAGKGETCKKMIRENRENITINPFVSISGVVSLCQVIFAGKGITSQMTPQKAVSNIKNLIISTTESGSQDNCSLLAAYNKLDKHLTEQGIERPVVLLSDGHSSRFDFKVLNFLREKQINLFVSPPDTTGVTQLLDQAPNQQLHRYYNNTRDELYSSFQTINRERFMNILGTMWNNWASAANIVSAAKRVGISKNGLNVDDMQQDKFEQAALLIDKTDDVSLISATPKKTRSVTSKDGPLATTPRSQSKVAQTKGRYGSAEYWKSMYEMSQSFIEESYEKSLNLAEVPGLLSVNRVKPKEVNQTKTTRVTNVHGSMEAQDVLSKVASLEGEKQKKICDSEEK